MRFFLDNCLPQRWAPALTALVKDEGHSVVHLLTEFPADAPDVEWLTALGREARQNIVISGDGRIIRNPHERAVWKQQKITAFFMHRGWARKKFWDKTWMFVRWFPTLVEQSTIVAPVAGFFVPVHYGHNKLKPI
jgi:hypothetical protein